MFIFSRLDSLIFRYGFLFLSLTSSGLMRNFYESGLAMERETERNASCRIAEISLPIP